MVRASSAFLPSLWSNQPGCDRQMRPNNSTLRAASSASTSPIPVPSPSSRSSVSPRKSAKYTQSPALVAHSFRYNKGKYSEPCTRAVTRLPSVQGRISGCTVASLGAGQEPIFDRAVAPLHPVESAQ